ncbi:hypothetical protein C8F04DRAFT_1276439 [Mycena alexandri]|uniref:Uncharacterized protein n=1 Tax=Mycena alexandri TaxID=1745969 RepID=A0AAD6WSG9_9AGAR|nr:hypothetical protein C8F04DRAFT_1276439 [Mycena alexandri]
MYSPPHPLTLPARSIFCGLYLPSSLQLSSFGLICAVHHTLIPIRAQIILPPFFPHAIIILLPSLCLVSLTALSHNALGLNTSASAANNNTNYGAAAFSPPTSARARVEP